MNEPSEYTSHADSNIGEVNGHAGHAALADSSGPTRFIQLSTRGRVGEPPMWNLSLRGQPLGTPNDRNNEFVTVFSHELRNSLGAIRSAVYILGKETSAGPAAVKARMLIERQISQMTRLVEDVLDESRLRRGQMTLQCQRVDLCTVAAQAVQTVEFTMQQRNQRMSTSFPNAPLWLRADPVRLEQILVNLLFNAAKYTDSGGHIGLSAEREGSEAVVRIRDSGVGIEPDVLPRVFDLFVQADPSSGRAGPGLGIGLALVRSLVERHGGRVTASSAGAGHGSEFTVRLPMPAE
jgi:signal transduction histidine kinase